MILFIRIYLSRNNIFLSLIKDLVNKRCNMFYSEKHLKMNQNSKKYKSFTVKGLFIILNLIISRRWGWERHRRWGSTETEGVSLSWASATSRSHPRGLHFNTRVFVNIRLLILEIHRWPRILPTLMLGKRFSLKKLLPQIKNLCTALFHGHFWWSSVYQI